MGDERHTQQRTQNIYGVVLTIILEVTTCMSSHEPWCISLATGIYPLISCLQEGLISPTKPQQKPNLPSQVRSLDGRCVHQQRARGAEAGIRQGQLHVLSPARDARPHGALDKLEIPILESELFCISGGIMRRRPIFGNSYLVAGLNYRCKHGGSVSPGTRGSC